MDWAAAWQVTMEAAAAASQRASIGNVDRSLRHRTRDHDDGDMLTGPGALTSPINGHDRPSFEHVISSLQRFLCSLFVFQPHIIFLSPVIFFGFSGALSVLSTLFDCCSNVVYLIFLLDTPYFSPLILSSIAMLLFFFVFFSQFLLFSFSSHFSLT
jgi:hypothetical protein